MRVWPGGIPAQLFSRLCAGGGDIPCSERCKPAKMSGGLFRRERDHRHLQSSTDDLSDVPDGHSLFRDRMIPGTRVALLQRQPVQVGGIEAVSRRPAVEPVADVRRNALFARDTGSRR